MRVAAASTPRRLVVVLGFGVLAFALAQTMLLPALPAARDQLGTDDSGIAWTVTAYLASAAVWTPVFGRLGDMFGKRRMLVVALAAFGAGSVLSATGESLSAMTAGRVVQGAGGGIFPLCFGIVRDELHPRSVAVTIGALSATIGAGAAAGLVLGGLIADHTSFRWIFWSGAAMAAVAAACTHRFVPESPIRPGGRVDLIGAVLLAGATTMLLVAVMGAGDHGFGTHTWVLLGLAAMTLYAWLWHERRVAAPLVDVRLLGDRTVWTTNLATFLVGAGMFGSFILTPQLAQAPTNSGTGLGLDATHAGLLMLPGALAMLVAAPLSGLLGSRVGSKVPLATGGALATVGLVAMALAHDHVLSLLAWNTVLASGIGLALAAMPNVIVEAVPRAQTGEATGVNALVRALGSAMGGQACAAVLAASAAGAATATATDGGYAAAYLVSAGVTALSCAVSAFIPRTRRGAPAPADAALLRASAGTPIA